MGREAKPARKMGWGCARTFRISLRNLGFPVQVFRRHVGGESGKQHDQALCFETRSLALVLGMDCRRRGQEGAQLRGDTSKNRGGTKQMAEQRGTGLQETGCDNSRAWDVQLAEVPRMPPWLLASKVRLVGKLFSQVRNNGGGTCWAGKIKKCPLVKCEDRDVCETSGRRYFKMQCLRRIWCSGVESRLVIWVWGSPA